MCFLFAMRKESSTYGVPAVGCLLGTAYQTLISQLGTDLKDAGLDITAGEYLVLRALYTEDGIQQCQIADMVGKDKAAICRCVAGLEKKEMVITESVSHKCLRVYLSDKAREIEPAIMDIAQKRHDALAANATPEELEIFIRILEKIVRQK